ncbi:MAG TPA: RNA polymerase sigma-70 factor [Ohtaekwangia sp.]|nr:RNA polymerase sigma-70 factor [Ohtaekwangia sp.]
MYSEENLVRRLSEGDEKAFKFLFDLYYRPLTLFALKYLGDIDEAKEIVQNLFVRIWLRRDTLQIKFSLKMYLYQSVRNASLNFLESSKVAQRRMAGYTTPESSNDNALENLLVAEQEELLMRAIDRLPAKCREIFLLSRMHRLPNQTIADQLHISVKTVEGQMSIALKRLAEWLTTLLIVALVIACFG